MPFVSEAQRRKCYALKRQMNMEGKVSTWDCKEFEKEKKSKSPRKIRRRTKTSPKKIGKKSGEQIFEGVRGGKYVVRNNRKVYV